MPLLSKDANITAENTLLLIYRALVLIGSASHAVTLEHHKIAWSRLNPKLNSLATEDYSKNANHFGPGFLEKTSKHLEMVVG